MSSYQEYIDAFQQRCSYDEWDTRRSNPITPNDPATIAKLAADCINLEAKVSRLMEALEKCKKVIDTTCSTVQIWDIINEALKTDV